MYIPCWFISSAPISSDLLNPEFTAMVFMLDNICPISLLGKTSATAKRPVEIVPIFVSDGSSNLTDTQILAKTADLELEFNGTVEEVPVFTEAGQNFTLANGASLSTQYTDSVTLFQF